MICGTTIGGRSLERFEQIFAEGRLGPVIDEIVSQSKVESNYDDD